MVFGATNLARAIHQVRKYALPSVIKRGIIYLPDPNTQAWLKGAMIIVVLYCAETVLTTGKISDFGRIPYSVFQKSCVSHGQL